ncbi:MAG: zinc ABC transporter substrate-binding protein [Bacteroidota bacterium]|nr:zinc ABC transporter substrate-binding protein [Bacteroidota bacterium]
MKRLLIPVLYILLIAGCTTRPVEQDKKIITVSIEPFRFFTSEIAGDSYLINVIVPPGASPATYEPPPAVIKDVNDSELMIINGYLGFERAWIDRLISLNKEIKVLKLAESQDLIMPESHKHSDTENYSGVDPHFWMSPQRASIIARDIKNFLVENDPEREKVYNSNYLRLDSIIKETDSYVKSLLGDSGNKSFMIFHPSLTYFARDYGLEQIPVEAEGKEPSLLEMKRLIDKGRKRDLETIFVQREFDTNNARLIGNEIGAKTIVIDPLSNNWVKSVKEIAENIAR